MEQTLSIINCCVFFSPVECTTADGEFCRVAFVLSCFPCDWQEANRASGTYNSTNAKYPCNHCTLPISDFYTEETLGNVFEVDFRVVYMESISLGYTSMHAELCNNEAVAARCVKQVREAEHAQECLKRWIESLFLIIPSPRRIPVHFVSTASWLHGVQDFLLLLVLLFGPCATEFR
jgi:hypothetical protein